MFNDFKLLSFDTTKQKILRLKDIFDRLNLSSLEKRLVQLETTTVQDNTSLNLQFGLCDLIVENITMEITEMPPTLSERGTVNITVTIKNIGTGISPKDVRSITWIYGDGAVLGNHIYGEMHGAGGIFVPSLQPNKTYIFNTGFTWNPMSWDEYTYIYIHLNWSGNAEFGTNPPHRYPYISNTKFPYPWEYPVVNAYVNEKLLNNNVAVKGIKLWNYYIDGLLP
jgi:hypothetical protein